MNKLALEAALQAVRDRDILTIDLAIEVAVRAYLAAAPEPPAPVPPAQGWRDISTAPKDGSEFLAVDATVGNQEPSVTRFNDDGWRTSAWGEGMYADAWWKSPTHWMPLPAPPTEARISAAIEPAPADVAIERLKVAIEGECEGLAIDDATARVILEYVATGNVPAPAEGGA